MKKPRAVTYVDPEELIDAGWKTELTLPVNPDTNSTVDDRERRLDLKCSHCPPNRKENAKRKPKSDRYKSRRKK